MLLNYNTVDTDPNWPYNNYMDKANKETNVSEYTYKSWEEYTPLEQAAATWWDMYKDAYGVRPRGTDTSEWTLDKFESEMKDLQDTIHCNERQRELDEAFNIRRFEARITSIIELGAKDRTMALRWIHEAEGSDGDNEYLCYCVGVPYGYIKS